MNTETDGDFAMFFLSSKIKENKNASEIIKTVNMLVSSMNSEYLWEYMTRRFCTSLRYGMVDGDRTFDCDEKIFMLISKT